MENRFPDDERMIPRKEYGLGRRYHDSPGWASSARCRQVMDDTMAFFAE